MLSYDEVKEIGLALEGVRTWWHDGVDELYHEPPEEIADVYDTMNDAITKIQAVLEGDKS